VPSSIILIGLRGSGKSTIGRLAAVRLGCGFVDLDDLTPFELGCGAVAEAWDRAGEAGFRLAETAALKSVLAADLRLIIALGGGTPTAPGVPDLLTEHRGRSGSKVVYLHAAPAELKRRLGACDNTHRPALLPGSKGPLDEVDAVYARRDALYRSLADAVVETEGETEAAVVARVVATAA
jgi:shikimate kinase